MLETLLERRAAVGSVLSVSPALRVIVRHINKAAVKKEKNQKANSSMKNNIFAEFSYDTVNTY